MDEFKRQLNRLQTLLEHFWQRVRAGSKLDIAIFVCAVLLALVLAAIVLFSLLGLHRRAASGETLQNMINSAPSAVEAADSGYDKTAGELSQSAYADTILPRTEDAGAAYLEETLFVGDSNTARMVAFGETTWQNNLGVVSMGVQHVLDSNCIRLEGYGYVDVPTAIGLMQPKRILITFGTNNAYSDTQTFIGWYRQAVKTIQEEWPYADIIIGAVPPVAKTRSYPDITMTTVDSFNQALVELAQEMGCKFLNASEALKGNDGYAHSGYMERDGIHLSEEGMDAWVEYIRTHAYETEDRRPKPLADVPEHYATPEEFFNPPAPEPPAQEPPAQETPASQAQSESQACAHNWAETNRQPASCITEGLVTYTCTLCGAQRTESLPATGHTWGATDANTGLRTCTVCGASETDPAWTPAVSTPAPPGSTTPEPAPPASSTPAPPAVSTPAPPSSTTPEPAPPASSTPTPPAASTPAPPASTTPEPAPPASIAPAPTLPSVGATAPAA